MHERKKPGLRGAAPRSAKSSSREGKRRSSAATSRKGGAPPVVRKSSSASQTHACPECGKTFRTDAAVQTHRHAAHGTAEMVVGNMTRCPECGSLVKNSHMARHKRREHGIV